jgi:lysozyme
MALDETYLDKIRKLEGFYTKPYWDHKQWSVGYGSRASGPNDVVDEAEAERRLGTEMSGAAKLVDQFAPGLDQGTRAALVSLTYNAGNKWMESGLGQAIKAGDLDKARASFLQYNKASGQTLPGLVNRRAQEVAWFGSGAPAGNPNNVAMNSASSGVSPTGFAGASGNIQTASPSMPSPSFTDTKPLSTTPSMMPKAPAAPGGAFGGMTMAGMGKGVGAFASAMGEGQQDSSAGEALAKMNASMLSDEEQRAAQALQMVTARNPRLRKQAGAFG